MIALCRPEVGPLGKACLPVRILFSALLFASALYGRAADTVPPKPTAYFNDYANVVPKEKAARLNEQLAQFERETSNQIVVAIYPKMESASDIFDYTQRVAQAWGVGQKDRRNGAVLFVFVENRKMYIQVGYGLEGGLPDATAKDITEHVIKPRFKNGDYAGGLEAGINAIIQATRGEYKGSGQTVLERRRPTSRSGSGPLTFIIFLIIVLVVIRLGRRRGGYGYTGFGGPFVTSGWGGGWSSSSSSGGGFSGFSGGGGSFGGGGAGSSW